MLQIRFTLLLIFIFCFGWLSNSVFSSFFVTNAENPYFFSYSSLKMAPERLSPADRVSENQIHVYNDKVILDIPQASWASFTDSNSMDPFLDKGTNSIEITPESPQSIHVGDIISYQSKATNDLIVHRVISKSVDEKGVFFLVKGDNNPSIDPQKIRFEEIHGILVGVIY